jgi:cytochrome P450
MDIIGDLAFGAPFGCLGKGEYHHWVRTLFSYLEGMSIAVASRFYPTMEFLFQKLIPKSVIEGQKHHSAYAEKMINRRLDTKSDRPDFMTPFMRNNVNFENMSRAEIISTFSFIIVGGSETSATTMTGIFNHLTKKKNKRVLQQLCNDIRKKFKEERDITIDALQATSIPYLEAVLNEGLRICNPIPSGLPRVVPEGGDDYCGIFLPGGVSTYRLQI